MIIQGKVKSNVQEVNIEIGKDIVFAHKDGRLLEGRVLALGELGNTCLVKPVAYTYENSRPIEVLRPENPIWILAEQIKDVTFYSIKAFYKEPNSQQHEKNETPPA